MTTIRYFDKYFGVLLRICEIIGAILLAEITIIALIGVICRYVINIPFVFADEILRYSSVWSILILSPVLALHKEHLMVDMTSILMPKKLRKPMFALGNFLCALFLVILIPSSLEMIKFGSRQVSTIMAIKMSYVYICVPFSVVMMALAFLRAALSDLFPEKYAIEPCKPFIKASMAEKETN